MRAFVVCVGVTVVMWAAGLEAQDPSTAGEAAAPPPEAAQAPPTAPSDASQPAQAPPTAPGDASAPPQAPPTAPGDASQPAPTSEAAACVPTCRAGFTCVDGSCVSACNPPCPEGEQCTAEGACVTAAPAAQQETAAQQEAAAIDDAELKAQLRERKLERKRARQQDIHAWREAHRYDHHLTIDVSGRATLLTVTENEDVTVAGMGVLSVGYMHNFVRNFGLYARLSIGLGGAALTSSRDYRASGYYTDADGSFANSVELEVVPYAGNFGPIYLGPMAFVGYRGYSKDRLVTERAGVPLFTESLKSRVVAGTGIGMGALLGSYRDMHLSWFVKTSFTEVLPFEAGVGFGYRFGRFWSRAQ